MLYNWFIPINMGNHRKQRGSHCAGKHTMTCNGILEMQFHFTIFNQLTWLKIQDFINASHHESFRPYVNYHVNMNTQLLQLTWAIRMPVRRLILPCGWTWWSFDRILPTSDVKVASTSTLWRGKRREFQQCHTISLLSQHLTQSHSNSTLTSEGNNIKSYRENIWCHTTAQPFCYAQSLCQLLGINAN